MCHQRRLYGPAFQTSADVFEDNINVLKRKAQGSVNYADQVARKYVLQKNLNVTNGIAHPDLFFLRTYRRRASPTFWHVDGFWMTTETPKLEIQNVSTIRLFASGSLKQHYIREGRANCVRRVRLGRLLYTSKRYSRLKNSSSYMITFRSSSEGGSVTRSQSQNVLQNVSKCFGEIEDILFPLDYDKFTKNDVYLVVKIYQIYDTQNLFTGLGNVTSKEFTRGQNDLIKKLASNSNTFKAIKKAKDTNKHVLVKGGNVLSHVLKIPASIIHTSRSPDFFYLSEDIFPIQKT